MLDGWSDIRGGEIPHINYSLEGVVKTVTESGSPLFAPRGRLEIFYGGQWATVCYDDGFGLREAHTACQQLGYLGATYVSAITDLR